MLFYKRTLEEFFLVSIVLGKDSVQYPLFGFCESSLMSRFFFPDRNWILKGEGDRVALDLHSYDLHIIPGRS